MRTLMVLSVVAISFIAHGSQAAFMEIEASQIASIQPSDSSQNLRILVQWIVPDLSNKVVDGAAITVTLGAHEGNVPAFDAFPMTTTWDATAVSWNSGWAKPGGDFDASRLSPCVLTDSVAGKIVADVYRDIRRQLAGQAANFGFILIPRSNSQLPALSALAKEPLALTAAKLIIAYRNKR